LSGWLLMEVPPVRPRVPRLSLVGTPGVLICQALGRRGGSERPSTLSKFGVSFRFGFLGYFQHSEVKCGESSVSCLRKDRAWWRGRCTHERDEVSALRIAGGSEHRQPHGADRGGAGGGMAGVPVHRGHRRTAGVCIAGILFDPRVRDRQRAAGYG